MIEYKTMDITTVTSGIIAHGVNCQGKMGSGVALAIRNHWPVCYAHYAIACKTELHLLGKIVTSHVSQNVFIAHCFTQQRYGYFGKFADERAVKACFESLDIVAKELGLPIYMPRIGCGLGGLDWHDDVEPLLSVFSAENRVTVCDWK